MIGSWKPNYQNCTITEYANQQLTIARLRFSFVERSFEKQEKISKLKHVIYYYPTGRKDNWKGCYFFRGMICAVDKPVLYVF